MQLKKLYKQIFFAWKNDNYEIRVYAIKENEQPAEKFEVMTFKNYKRLSPYVYTMDLTAIDNYKDTWFEPNDALAHLIDMAKEDIKEKRILPYILEKLDPSYTGKRRLCVVEN